MSSRATPAVVRVISLIWAVWAWVTCVAYTSVEPSQLDPVMVWLPVNLSHAWATVAVLLTGGAVLPDGHRGISAVARWARTIGVVLAAALLCAFATAFILNGGRGWVSAKNYAMLAVGALACSLLVGRSHGQVVR